MTPITIHFLVKNDEDKIESTIQSLLSLDAHFIIGNLGTTDTTLEICKSYFECPIVTFGVGSRSEMRNRLVELSNTDWQFFLEPGEVLSTGHDLLLGALQGEPLRRLYVIQGDMITKDIRLWKKGTARFENPVFENLQPDDHAQPLNTFIEGRESPNYLNELLGWKKISPHLAEIDYYLACQYLVLKDYDNFILAADSFLFKEMRPTYPVVMTRYYLGLVYTHIKRDSHEATRNLMFSISQRPLMAEFWCALGDCFYWSGATERAMEFYRNAQALGKHRATDDPYPIELSKYGEYPQKMMSLCKEIIKKSI